MTKLRTLALTYLSCRDHSTHELRQKLRRKGFSSDNIDLIIIDLKAAGYLNDDRYAIHFIHYHRNRGYGPLRIKAQLQAKGIALSVIAQHIELADNAWFIAAEKVFKKYSRGKVAKEAKSRAKQIRFLHYRGFTQEQIDPIFKQYSPFDEMV